MSRMPILPLSTMVADCNDQEKEIVSAAFTTRGVKNKDDGFAKLRASKPFARVETFEQGCANYVWRMLCFDFCSFHPHCCMPVSADFDLSWGLEHRDGERVRYGQPGYDEQRHRERELTEQMKALIDRVESVLPVTAQKGVMRWGQALGMLPADANPLDSLI